MSGKPGMDVQPTLRAISEKPHREDREGRGGR